MFWSEERAGEGSLGRCMDRGNTDRQQDSRGPSSRRGLRQGGGGPRSPPAPPSPCSKSKSPSRLCPLTLAYPARESGVRLGTSSGSSRLHPLINLSGGRQWHKSTNKEGTSHSDGPAMPCLPGPCAEEPIRAIQASSQRKPKSDRPREYLYQV